MAILFQWVGGSLVVLGLTGCAGRLLYENLRRSYPRRARAPKWDQHDDADF